MGKEEGRGGGKEGGRRKTGRDVEKKRKTWESWNLEVFWVSSEMSFIFCSSFVQVFFF